MFTYLLTHKLFSSCIQRYLVSRACDWVMPALSAVLLTFSFQFSLLFFHVGSQAAKASYVVYPLSDIGRYRKCGKHVPCTRRTAQGKDFELILTLTRRLYCVEWSQYSIRPKRSAICNRCFSGPTRGLNANCISLASEVFAGLTRWQTGRPRYSIVRNRRHLPT